MRIVLLCQEANFVGREYYARLEKTSFRPLCVAYVGRMKPGSVEREIERTGGKWTPPAIPSDAVRYRFRNPSDSELAHMLAAEHVDVAIQGGVGILDGPVISAPRIGWLNVHPGQLPSYRGNSCPEWAILNNEDVVATAHLIDAGIDTGPVVHAATYPRDQIESYEDFRAGLYGHCADVLIAALGKLARHGLNAAVPQAERDACYREPIPAHLLQQVKSAFANRREGRPTCLI